MRKIHFDFQLPIADLKSKIGNLKSRGVEMSEAVQEKIESGHGPQTTDTDHGHGHVFEPEILAFCCEH